MPDLFHKLCLNSLSNQLQTKQLLKSLIQLVLKLTDKSLIKFNQILSEIIQSIFSILVYRAKKINLDDLIGLITGLSKRNISQINTSIEKNLDIFYLYFKKGKDIEKVFFSFKKIILSNPRILAKGVQELIKINEETKNRLLLAQSLKLIKKCLKGKPFRNLKEDEMSIKKSVNESIK